MLPVIPAKRIQTEKHNRSQRKSALLSFVFACYIIKSIINQLKFGKKNYDLHVKQSTDTNSASKLPKLLSQPITEKLN